MNSQNAYKNLTQAEIEHLASEISLHKNLYYSGKSVISDAAFDALEDQLRQVSPEHPILSLVGKTNLGKKGKIQHIPPMLSLNKTYDISEFHDFCKKYSCVLMDKVDGMALSLKYNDKGQLVEASSRGNGVFGENWLAHIQHVIEIPKKIPTNKHKLTMEIRGEIFFPLSKFKKFEDIFDSFRNAVAGVLNRKDISGSVDILRCFAFAPYDILIFDTLNQTVSDTKIHQFFPSMADRFSERLKFIQSLGFQNALGFLNSYDWNEMKTDQFQEKIVSLMAKNRDYKIDGLVARCQSQSTWEALGTTSHHPRGSLAYKQANEKAETHILTIEQNVGRSGKISFRAKLKPIFLANATISYATLHNAQYIEDGDYREGSLVEVIRSGEVIPAITQCLDNSSTYPYKLPEKCLCGFSLKRIGPDLFCLENPDCPWKDQESFVHFVRVLEINGVSTKIIEKLKQAGFLNEFSDFFRLSISDLLQVEGFAQKSAENFVNAFQAKKEIPLSVFLTALGIHRGGAVKCAEIANTFRTLDKVLTLTPEMLTELPGWAEKSATEFIKSLHSKKIIIADLLDVIVVQEETRQTQKKILSGLRICITGTLSISRKEVKKIIEKHGGQLVTQVTSATDYLICNERSQSTKYQDALKYQIPILSEQDFLTLISGDENFISEKSMRQERL